MSQLEIGDLTAFSTKFKLSPGGYRWIQHDYQQYLVRILKCYNRRTWRPNGGLGERKYRFDFRARVVDPDKIRPILAASETITYGSDTIYITNLKMPPKWKRNT